MIFSLDSNQATDLKEFKNTFKDLKVIPHKSGNLQVIASIADGLSLSQFKNSLCEFGFSILKNCGSYLEIAKEHKEQRVVPFSVFFDVSNQIALFITDAKKTDEIPHLLFEYINLSGVLSNLWIAPMVMKEIKDDLAKQHTDLIITYFSAKRGPTTKTQSHYRPDIGRGIQYRGSDGKHTLEEMEFYYGVLPRILDFSIPSVGSFRLDNNGIITVREGAVSGIFDILDHITERIRPLQDAISNSSYNPIQNKKTNLTYNIQKPWSLNLSQPVDTDTIQQIIQEIHEEEWEFTILNRTTDQKNNYLEARLIDNLSGSLIDIEARDQGINIYPVEKTSIGSSMRFFELIIESVDAMAVAG